MRQASTRGRCEQCQKILYATRRAAKSALRRLHPGEHMSPYACPAGLPGYHVGHLPRVVRKGNTDRRDYYGRTA